MYIINHLRTYQTTKTTGEIIIDGTVFGYTIEDIGRPFGIKIPAETCIPEGLYKVAYTDSPKFGRKMLQLYTDDLTKHCTHGGVSFSGIRVHHASGTEHVEGCVGYARTSANPLEALESLIVAKLALGPVYWAIGRKP